MQDEHARQETLGGFAPQAEARVGALRDALATGARERPCHGCVPYTDVT